MRKPRKSDQGLSGDTKSTASHSIHNGVTGQSEINYGNG